MMIGTVIFSSFNNAIKQLEKTTGKVIVINHDNVVYTAGALSVHYIMQKLQNRFEKIEKVVVNASDNFAALISLIELGYKEIVFDGECADLAQLIQDKMVNIMPMNVFLARDVFPN